MLTVRNCTSSRGVVGGLQLQLNPSGAAAAALEGGQGCGCALRTNEENQRGAATGLVLYRKQDAHLIAGLAGPQPPSSFNPVRGGTESCLAFSTGLLGGIEGWSLSMPDRQDRSIPNPKGLDQKLQGP
jgi:hypothetical protein